MKKGETQNGDGAHDAVEDDEIGFVLHDAVGPSVGHFRDTEHAAGEDGQIGEAEGAGEELEVPAMEQGHGGGREGGAVLVGSEAVVSDQDAEGEQRKDLPRDPGHHEVVAEVLGATGVCRSGDAAAGALQDEGEQIAQDEDPGVVLRPDAGVVAADGQHEVFQGEVDARGEEGGRDDQAGDLDVEAVAVKRVVVQHDTPDVADRFAETAKAQRDHVGPRAPSYARDEVEYQADGEEDEEEIVCSQ